MLRFYEETFNLLHKSSYSDFMDEWSRATDYNLYFKSYEEKIHTAISNDTKEVREYLNDKDWKGQAKSALRKSLRRFQDDYCLLAMVLFFDEFKLIFDEFIESVFKAYKIKITPPIFATKNKRGNPNFKSKRIPNKVLVEFTRHANRLIQENPDMYKPRKNAKSSSQLNYALNNVFKEYEPARIGDNFRKKIIYDGIKFKVKFSNPCLEKINKYVY